MISDLVDVCTFALCVLRRKIDEDTHPANTLRRAVGSSILEKRTVEVYFVQSHDQTARTSPSTFPFLPSSQCQRADLGSLFRGRRRRKQSFLNFGNKTLLPVARQQLCPFRNRHRRAARPFVSNEAGYRGGRFCCQHPKMTKPTKFKTIGSARRKHRRAGLLRPPRQ